MNNDTKQKEIECEIAELERIKVKLQRKGVKNNEIYNTNRRKPRNKNIHDKH